jgi:rubredoxin
MVHDNLYYQERVVGYPDRQWYCEKKERTMNEKIWWKCNGCGYLIQQDVGKEHPKPCPACKKECTFTNVTCYTPECGGPQSSNFDPSLM